MPHLWQSAAVSYAAMEHFNLDAVVISRISGIHISVILFPPFNIEFYKMEGLESCTFLGRIISIFLSKTFSGVMAFMGLKTFPKDKSPFVFYFQVQFSLQAARLCLLFTISTK